MRSDPSSVLRISKLSHPLNTDEDLDRLIELIGESKYVLPGEASHGIHEYPGILKSASDSSKKKKSHLSH